MNIKQSFCITGEFNKTFSVNQSQFIEAIDFLCNNLSAINLKIFLINVQKQFDRKFLVKKEIQFQLNCFKFIFHLD